MNKFLSVLLVGLICLSASAAHARSCEDKRLRGIEKGQKYLDKAIAKQDSVVQKHNNKLASIENGRANALARIDMKEAACTDKVAKAVSDYLACIGGAIFDLSTSRCGKTIDRTTQLAACYAKTNQQKDAVNDKYDRKVAAENASYGRKLPLAEAKTARMQERLDVATAVVCAPVPTPTPVV